jgi:hypothetical protein
MSENFYFDIKGRSAMPFQVYIGGRGIGKSYSALRQLALDIPTDEKWIYMRRTGKEIEACSTEFGNPFKTINKDFGTVIVPESGGKGAAEYFYNETDEDNPILVGYGVALSTFAGLRSMDLSDVTVTVFDEFIPERQVKRIKAEGEALGHNFVNGKCNICNTIKIGTITTTQELPLIMDSKVFFETKGSIDAVTYSFSDSKLILKIDYHKIYDKKGNTAMTGFWFYVTIYDDTNTPVASELLAVNHNGVVIKR